MFLHADVAIPMATTETRWYSHVAFCDNQSYAKWQLHKSSLGETSKVLKKKMSPRKITCVIVSFDAIVQLFANVCIVWQVDPNSRNSALGNNGRKGDGRRSTWWEACKAPLCCVVLCCAVCNPCVVAPLCCVVLCCVVCKPSVVSPARPFFLPNLDPILLLATIGGHLVVGGLQPLCCGSGYGNGCEEVSPCQRGRRMRPRDNSCQLNPLPDAIQNILRLMGKWCS